MIQPIEVISRVSIVLLPPKRFTILIPKSVQLIGMTIIYFFFSQHLADIEATASQYKDTSESILHELAVSNDSYRASFRSAIPEAKRLQLQQCTRCLTIFCAHNSMIIMSGLHCQSCCKEMCLSYTLYYTIHDRLFQEGGNYCPDEVDYFSKKIVSLKSHLT